MTIAELIMALMITSLIATAVTGALVAVSYGTDSRRDWRRLTVKTNRVRALLQDAVAGSRAVLASGADGNDRYVVLWKGDTTEANDAVNLGELQLILWDQSASSLISYETDTAPNPDTEYAAGAGFYGIASGAAGSTLPATLWSDDITACAILADAAGSQARLLTWSMTLEEGLFDESVEVVAALREPNPPE